MTRRRAALVLQGRCLMSSSKSSLSKTLARVTSAIVGVQKNLSTVAQISLAGVVYSPTTLLALLQAYAKVTVITCLLASIFP